MDVETGELRFRPILHFGDVTALAFSPDGSIFASGNRSGDDAVYLWDSQTGEAVHTFVGHALYVTDIAFSPDGQTLASSSYDGTILLWDMTTLAPNR